MAKARRSVPGSTNYPSQKVGDAIKDATAPLVVNDQIAKLCRRYGTERTMAAIEAWLAYMKRIVALEAERVSLLKEDQP